MKLMGGVQTSSFHSCARKRTAAARKLTASAAAWAAMMPVVAERVGGANEQRQHKDDPLAADREEEGAEHVAGRLEVDGEQLDEGGEDAVETCHRSITTPAPTRPASERKRRRMGFAARKRIPERIIATTAMKRKLNRMSSFIGPCSASRRSSRSAAGRRRRGRSAPAGRS